MIGTHTQTNPWAADCEILQCIDCNSPLEPADGALACLSCRRRFPVRDGVLDLLPALQGNNKVAADYYNGPLWPKFRFWEWFTFLLNGGDRKARNQVLKHLGNLSGTRLLEVGIGDGSNLPYIPADCKVYGNDISTVQVADCRRKFPRRDIRLLLNEAERMPFRDRTFDNVFSLGSFNYFNDPLQALREMARVVKPEGRIVIADEMPDLPNRLIGHWIGLPKLDRWIMSKVMKLSPEFTDLVDRHRHLKLEPIAKEVLEDWQIHSIWLKLGYCIVGRPKR